ncbi:hypothetical protein INS49_010155 [Diaporthe citri]|uniref:uncharacterized protein n=1 Tax=Diaporthe citri TaxID=83186 RepID=UPI001C7EAA22|nr:uncharacterized protein INS49_010155 [Diaporthe citri]KAG6361926.1 hypothetical protein INS49_010155 [Diaporthe citri]
MNELLPSTDNMPPATEFTNIFAEELPEFDWENYLKARPDYTGSTLYDRLFAYHDAHSGSYDTAYDVGCGPGQVVSALAEKFSRVHGSDPNAFIISKAREAFKAFRNVSLEVGKAEAVISANKDRAGTADLITAAECIPLMDIDAAMSAFAKLLRPAGTLAIWFYGGPIFAIPGLDEHSPEVTGVQALFQEILNRSYDEFRPFKGSVLEKPCTMIESWLDNVAFDPAQFKDVERVKWNTDRELHMLGRDAIGFDMKHINLIGEGEIVVDEGVDRSFLLRENVDFDWAKGFIDSAIARKKYYITDEVGEMLGRLEAKMKGIWVNKGILLKRPNDDLP